MSNLLAFKFEPGHIVLLVCVVLLLVMYPVVQYIKSKKSNQQMQERINSIKRKDKVLLSSGIFGTVIDLHQEDDKTLVTIETGMGKNKGYLTVDAYAIYDILPAEQPEEKVEVKAEQKAPEVEKTEENKVEEKEESKEEAQSKEEKPNAKPKRSRKKKEEK